MNRNEKGAAPANSSPQSKMLMAAVCYATRFNFSVFPCLERGKTPLTAHGCKDATRDISTLEAWWTQWANANVAIATGTISGSGLLVLDIDGDEGRQALRSLEQTHGSIPSTPQVLTGNGEQYYFQAPCPLKNRVRIAPGIDIRADGGYVIAPPSVHPNGKVYTWELSGRIDENPIADAPEWFVRLCSGDPSGGHDYSAKTSQFWRTLVSAGAAKGHRNDSTARLAGYLLRRFVDPLVVVELIRAWNVQRNVPPLSDDELVRTVDSIAGAESVRRKGFFND